MAGFRRMLCKPAIMSPMKGLTCGVLLLALAATAAQSPAPAVITGRLIALAEKSVALKSGAKETRLTSKDDVITAILADGRLLGKELRAEGRWEEKDRLLEVQKLHIVHDGKLYEIHYYCEICNIWASKPGPCVCCQQPVGLRELPAEEAEKNRGINPKN